MKALLVIEMEMPECCGYCPFNNYDGFGGYVCDVLGKYVESADRHPNCPLQYYETFLAPIIRDSYYRGKETGKRQERERYENEQWKRGNY